MKFSDEKVYDTARKALIDGGDVREIINRINSLKERINPNYRYSDVKEKLKIDLYFKKK